MFKIIAVILTVAALLIPGLPRIQPQPVFSQPRQETLTAQQAEEIALAHASLTAQKVTGLHSQLDRDDRTDHWDVEFFYDGWEYDYEVDAETGAILSWDKDYDD